MDLGPGVSGGALEGWLREKLEVDDAAAAVADGSSDAVGTRVTATDDDHFLPLGGDVFAVFQVAVQQALRVCMQELHGEVDPGQLPPRYRKISARIRHVREKLEIRRGGEKEEGGGGG